MTGITVDLTSLTGVAERAADAAGRLRGGTDPGGGLPPVFALPQAARFLTAFTAARDRQAGAAGDFARFYADAGAALTDLTGKIADGEDAAARRLDGTDRLTVSAGSDGGRS